MEELPPDPLEDLPQLQEKAPPALSQFYYNRRKEGTLWLTDPTQTYPDMDFNKLEGKLLDLSPLEKGLILSIFAGVWLGVAYLQRKSAATLGKIAKIA